VGYGILKYYSLNEVSSSVGVYDVVYPKVRGDDCLSLKLVQTISNYGPTVPLGNIYVKSAEIRIVGDSLYASNRNDTTFGPEKDSIATFKIGATGAPTATILDRSRSTRRARMWLLVDRRRRTSRLWRGIQRPESWGNWLPI
jgi:hypothetical protein